ncbi:MAG: flavodoxin [Methanosphaera sp.]|nr:flavodoxin [Methanosphaera sp.]
MTDIVIYYSRTKNTKKVAEIIARKYNAETLEVKDKQRRSGLLGFVKSGYDSIRENDTKIEYDKLDLKDYDTIFIGTPVWASKPTPAIVQFIKENEFSGTKCVTFATMMGSGGETTINVINNMIISQGGTVKDSFILAVKNKDIEELTNEAMDDLNL